MKSNKLGSFHPAFTVDVEDGVSLAMRDYYGQEVPMTDRVVSNTSKILDVLAEHGTKGTFFVLGTVGEVFPELVKRISREGHEVGAHGHNHYKFTHMSRAQALEELTRAKKVLEDLTECAVLGHRAPEFSIQQDHPWAFEVISEAGFVYDASLKPTGAAEDGASFDICRIALRGGGELIQFPLSAKRMWGRSISVCGGRYFQVLPYALNRRWLRQVLRARHGVFYMHPYEIDTDPYPQFYEKAFRQASLKKRINRHIRWIGKGGNLRKINHLLKDFEFGRIRDILAAEFPEISTLRS